MGLGEVYGYDPTLGPRLGAHLVDEIEAIMVAQDATAPVTTQPAA